MGKMIDYYRDPLSFINTNNENQVCYESKTLIQAHNFNSDCANTDAILNIIGESSAVKKVRHLISLHSRYDAPVLITGETGTGKELAARGLHYNGNRASQPFIPVNCATLTDELFASEVFGHTKGSFTDAKRDKKGLLGVAEKGTLFLDEVDSLSLKSQAALLRFLQEKEYRPVGSETTYTSNARLIASANCDLEERIQKGLFRADLYYRLYILNIYMPPLRERENDVAILIEHFIRQFDAQYNQGLKQVSLSLLDLLEEKSWPGNIRELENLIHRLYLCCVGDTIDLSSYASSEFFTEETPSPKTVIDIDNNSPGDEAFDYVDGITNFSFSRDKRKAVEIFEYKYVEKVMKESNGNITLAAQLCGKERRAFGKLVKKYNIKENLHQMQYV